MVSREPSFSMSQGTYQDLVNEVGVTELQMALDLLKQEQHYNGMGDCLQGDAAFSGQEFVNLLPDSTQLNTVMPEILPVSTSVHPSMEDYPGPYGFDIELSKSAGDRTKWEHSSKLNKIFVNMNTKIPLNFKVNSVEPGLFIRVLPIFLAHDSLAEPVKRCPTHKSTSEISNKDFVHVEHIIRCHHQAASYHQNSQSGRLSVVVPTEPPQPGCEWFTVVCSFTCKNSCGLGMNRRSTALIITLEKHTGEVLGRKVLNYRVCSCPRRDMIKEEKDLDEKNLETAYEMDNESTDEKLSVKCIPIKKPKRLSDGLVNIRISKKYLKPIREMILMNKPLSIEERTCLEDINKLLL